MTTANNELANHASLILTLASNGCLTPRIIREIAFDSNTPDEALIAIANLDGEIYKEAHLAIAFRGSISEPVINALSRLEDKRIQGQLEDQRLILDILRDEAE